MLWHRVCLLAASHTDKIVKNVHSFWKRIKFSKPNLLKKVKNNSEAKDFNLNENNPRLNS